MFSWASGNGSKTYPGRRSQQQQQQQQEEPEIVVEGSRRPPSTFTRAQHLKSYVEDATLKRSTRRVSSDDTTYDTVFQTTDGDTLILRVNVPLASSFATSHPAMSLAGIRCKHAWVEPQRMRVTGYDPLRSESHWNESGMLLGNAVHDVVKYFQLNPPQVLEFTDRGLESVQKKNQRGGGARSKSPRNTTNGGAPPSYDAFAKGASSSSMSPQRRRDDPSAPDVPLPAIPRSFPAIGEMGREELERHLAGKTKDDGGGDDDPFEAFAESLPLFEELRTLRDSKTEENIRLAEENLKEETRLKELHATVAAKQKELQEKIATFRELEAQQNDLCRPPDKKLTLKRLNRAKKEAFQESEDYAAEWIEDDGASVDDFVRRFVELRKVHHSRGAKMEILQNSHQEI